MFTICCPTCERHSAIWYTLAHSLPSKEEYDALRAELLTLGPCRTELYIMHTTGADANLARYEHYQLLNLLERYQVTSTYEAWQAVQAQQAQLDEDKETLEDIGAIFSDEEAY